MSQKGHQAITFASLFISACGVLDVSRIAYTFLVSFIIPGFLRKMFGTRYGPVKTLFLLF